MADKEVMRKEHGRTRVKESTVSNKEEQTILVDGRRRKERRTKEVRGNLMLVSRKRSDESEKARKINK